MPDILGFDFETFALFFLVQSRVAAILFTAPVFGSNNIPTFVKLSAALVVSLFIFYTIPRIPLNIENMDSWSLSIMMLKEVMIGYMIGLIPRILTGAIDLAGSMISYQMGFGLADVIDPSTGNRVQVISDFKNTFALLVFLGINAHYVIFESIVLSFQKIPFGGLTLNQNIYDEILLFAGDLFIIGFKLAAPITAVILLVNLVMGLLARSMPQMNVFMVGLPLTVGIGLIILFFGIPITANVIELLFIDMGENMLRLIQILPGV